MERRDYLKKQIDQLAKALAKILLGVIDKEQKGQVNIEVKETSEALKNELGYTTEELLAISTEEFISKLQTEKSIGNESLEILADLFMDLADSTNDEVKRRMLYEKSLSVYLCLEKSDSVYSYERHLKIEILKGMGII